MLRPEHRGDVHPRRHQCVETVRQVFGHRRRMREQRDAFAVKGSAQSGVDEQPIDTEFHGASGAASRATKQSRAWKSGAPSGCASAHSALAPDISSITIVRPTRSEEHTSELQSLMRISYAVFCLKKN